MLLAHKTLKNVISHRTPCEEIKCTKREYVTSQTPGGDKDIKAVYKESNKTLKGEHVGHLTPRREQDNTPYGDDNSSPNEDQDTCLTVHGEHESLRTP